MGKSATKAIVMLLKFFTKKVVDGGGGGEGGDLKCCGAENLLAPPGFLLAPDQKSWLLLCVTLHIRKNAQVVTSLQTNCYKSVHKLSTSCLRTACSQLL